MYTNRFNFRSTHSAVLLAALSCSTTTLASTAIVSYDFDDAMGAFENAPEIAVSGIDATPWFDERGSLTDFTGNPGRALAARTFLDGNTLTLLLNISSGFVAHLDGFFFDHMASSSGPTNWELKINAAPVAADMTSTSFASESGELSMANISDMIAVDLSGFGAASNSGTYRLDNFVLTGTVTPVPIVPAIVLFGSALAFMPKRRKR